MVDKLDRQPINVVEIKTNITGCNVNMDKDIIQYKHR